LCLENVWFKKKITHTCICIIPQVEIRNKKEKKKRNMRLIYVDSILHVHVYVKPFS
jgi:hypothetical protein